MDAELLELKRFCQANPDDLVARHQYRNLLIRSDQRELAGLLPGDYVEIHKGFAQLGPVRPMIWYGIIIKICGTDPASYTISPLMEDKDFAFPGREDDPNLRGTARSYRDTGIYVSTGNMTENLLGCRVILIRPVHPDDPYLKNWRLWKAVKNLESWRRTSSSWDYMVPDDDFSGATNINYIGEEARKTAKTYKDILGPWCPWHPGHYGSNRSIWDNPIFQNYVRERRARNNGISTS